VSEHIQKPPLVERRPCLFSRNERNVYFKFMNWSRVSDTAPCKRCLIRHPWESFAKSRRSVPSRGGERPAPGLLRVTDLERTAN